MFHPCLLQEEGKKGRGLNKFKSANDEEEKDQEEGFTTLLEKGLTLNVASTKSRWWR